MYGDERAIRVINGKTGAVLYQIAQNNGTAGEQPVIADVDNDGHADFLIGSDTYWGGTLLGLRAFQGKGNKWLPTRAIWNQYAYSITNISDDLTVPRNPVPSWQAHNTFRLNKRLDGDARALADLTVGYLRVTDGGAAGSTLAVRVGNAGAYKIPSGTKFAVYNTSPALGTPTLSTLKGTATLSAELQPGQWQDLGIRVSGSLENLSPNGQMWIVGDDDGRSTHVLADFDRSNNTLVGDISSIATNLRIGVAADKASYNEVDQAVLVATVTNAGSYPRNAQVRFTVLDQDGAPVQVLALPAPNFVGVGAANPAQAVWPVAGTLPGNYWVLAELVTADGVVYGSATTDFTVSASQQLVDATRIMSDRDTYSAAELVQLSSRAINLTSNAAREDLRAITIVRRETGEQVFSETEAIAHLAPGAQIQYHYGIAGGSLAMGTYRASLQLLDAKGSVLSQSTTSFGVLGTESTGVGLTGQLQAAPTPALIGMPVALSLNAVNNGTTPLGNVPITVRVLEPQSATVLGSFTQVVSTWPQGTAQTLVWDWVAHGLDGQTLVAIASASIAGRDVALGQAAIRLMGVPKLRMEPALLTFSPIYVGENASQAVVLQSVGTVAAGSITFTLAGADASQYAIPQGGCAESASLPMGATCTLSISWRPQTAGSHVGEVRVGYSNANGEPAIATLAGQAKTVIFSGAVSADAPEVEAGQGVGLSYSVSNPATVTSTMDGALSVRDPSGAILRSWPVNRAVPGLAAYASSEPYATGAEAQTLTVALSQQVGSSNLVLATTTFTLIDPAVPVGVATGLKGQARILVLVSCPPGLGTAEDAACQSQRARAVANYLAAVGLGAKVVTTREAFLAEMRCGTYNTYWLSGGAIKLDEQAVGELREAVYRGEALWMDSVHDSRNQLLHPAAGVREIGKLPDRDLAAGTADQGLYGAGTMPTLGQASKFELTTGAVQGFFAQVPGQQAPIPAIVSNDWGRGKSLLFAFDLAAMLTADPSQDDAQLRGLVNASVRHAASASSTLTLGDLTQLAASVGNQGTRTVAFRAEASLPAALVSIATVPPAQITANTDGSALAVWNFILPGGATQELDWLVRAQQVGSHGAPLTVYSLPSPGSTLPPKLRASTTWSAEVRGADSLLEQVMPTVDAVDPAAASDKGNKSKALAAAAGAIALHRQGSYEAAIVQWLASADALAAIKSADATAARSAVALAMEASTDALCIQRCGTAACQ